MSRIQTIVFLRQWLHLTGNERANSTFMLHIATDIAVQKQ